MLGHRVIGRRDGKHLVLMVTGERKLLTDQELEALVAQTQPKREPKPTQPKREPRTA